MSKPTLHTSGATCMSKLALLPLHVLEPSWRQSPPPSTRCGLRSFALIWTLWSHPRVHTDRSVLSPMSAGFHPFHHACICYISFHLTLTAPHTTTRRDMTWRDITNAQAAMKAVAQKNMPPLLAPTIQGETIDCTRPLSVFALLCTLKAVAQKNMPPFLAPTIQGETIDCARPLSAFALLLRSQWRSYLRAL